MESWSFLIFPATFKDLNGDLLVTFLEGNGGYPTNPPSKGWNQRFFYDGWWLWEPRLSTGGTPKSPLTFLKEAKELEICKKTPLSFCDVLSPGVVGYHCGPHETRSWGGNGETTKVCQVLKRRGFSLDCSFRPHGPKVQICDWGILRVIVVAFWPLRRVESLFRVLKTYKGSYHISTWYSIMKCFFQVHFIVHSHGHSTTWKGV